MMASGLAPVRGRTAQRPWAVEHLLHVDELNVWHHWACTYALETRAILVDGVVAGTDTADLSHGNPRNLSRCRLVGEV